MWLTDILTGSVDKVIDSIGNVADKLFTSDEERLKAKILIEKAQNELKLELGKQALEYDKQTTERWKSDNEHLMTRLIRPLSYAWVLFMFTVIMVGDGNWGFTIKEVYIPVIESLMVTMTIAYFGSRGIEKTTKFLRK